MFNYKIYRSNFIILPITVLEEREREIELNQLLTDKCAVPTADCIVRSLDVISAIVPIIRNPMIIFIVRFVCLNWMLSCKSHRRAHTHTHTNQTRGDTEYKIFPIIWFCLKLISMAKAAVCRQQKKNLQENSQPLILVGSKNGCGLSIITSFNIR